MEREILGGKLESIEALHIEEMVSFHGNATRGIDRWVAIVGTRISLVEARISSVATLK